MKLASRLMSVLLVTKILAIVFVVLVGIVFMIKRETFPISFTHPFTVVSGHATDVTSISLSFYGVVWAYDGW